MEIERFISLLARGVRNRCYRISIFREEITMPTVFVDS